ncbi:Os05g0390800 [Oryza sativa Japonica Group]|uniref:Os05g0390800 protein n=1 Tax=Oryza sativa subsp. japonica TaxID=39947 RepID=C7J336_ORYSJ|nr:Os05g0390800 [Oryza sativa Japonica Group]|eukprot:NP_001174406.1 Os05g0390800 [Oryza sativa Japonica Group]
MDRQRQQSSRGNASATATRGGGGGGGGKGGGNGKAAAAGKKPIKVVYISNPMRVRTSAAGFRALVQELTGRNADPSKYSPRASAGDDGGGATALPDTGAASDADALEAGAAPGRHPAETATFDEGGGGGGGGYDDDDDDVFRSQLLDTSYSVFSPPTLLYDDHPHSKSN